MTQPPLLAPWPERYSETFEKYETGQTPRYFMDQAGAFEVAKSAKGAGRSLEQIVTAKGIEWPFHLNPFPETFLGSPTWGDYEVAVQALLPGDGFVSLFGRVGKVPQNASPPDGYGLKVDQDGFWELGTASVALASGQVTFPIKRWHELKLAFKGDAIRARIDGVEVAKINDTTYVSGLAGLGCGWHRAQFDDLVIVVAAADRNLALGQPATASSSEDVDALPANAFDGDAFTTRWSAARGKTAGEWLELDLRQAVTFDTVVLRQHEDRITGYRIEWWNAVDSRWETAASGGHLGLIKTERFRPATADRVRLLVTAAKDSPSVWEFQLHHGQ